MKAQIIHSIHSDLEEIKDLFDYYEQHPDNIPEIELDISLSKFRDIYQQVLQLKKMQSDEPAEAPAYTPEQEKQLEKEQEDPHLENIDQSTNDAEPEKETAQNENPSVKQKTEEATSEISDSGKEQRNRQLTDRQRTTEQKIISDKYQEQNRSVGDSLGEKQTKKDVSHKMKNQPIGDLQKAFGINDRFLYTKELFNGNRAQFNETIDELNQASNLDDALAYINNQFDWDPDNEYRQGLIHLLERKFQS